MTSFNKNTKLLIIAPHPDDEVIGNGGLIQKVKSEGGKVFVIFMTLADTPDFTKAGLSTLKEREREIKKAASFLKYDDYEIVFKGEDFHLKLDKLGQLEIANVIERKSSLSLEKIKPTIVSFPEYTSYNQDHRVCAYATHSALRNSSKDKYFVKTAISYEEAADGWSLTPKSYPNFYITLTEKEIKNKFKALKLYKSQWRLFPSSRSEDTLYALAKLRGSESMNSFAEAFTIHREVL
jgi:N-acetylglucosamine malate deacetylase 1